MQNSSYQVAFKNYWCHLCQNEQHYRLEGEQLNSEQFCQNCGCVLEQIVTKQNHPKQYQIYQQQPRIQRVFYHIIFFNDVENEHQNVGATEDQIKNMKKQTHQGEQEKTCYICQEDFRNGEQIAMMNCNHGFHEDCIAKWLRMNNSCPVCRCKQN
ncbi:unnamed protein product [Paramecium primaurelia]|uniref:RING-type domain-containing protein n=1 Tax=Paramecium primaurelia TaxID=5886 RepID=A0A8S1L671_PARPR|nr:unnamed protein product [Paramecium primaurelia]